ncbi:MAG TPA: hypothetical protein VJP77_02485 [Planctomycetota bacterium]|nr:hypothetical protein [Planctomycetota bacterium]
MPGGGLLADGLPPSGITLYGARDLERHLLSLATATPECKPEPMARTPRRRTASHSTKNASDGDESLTQLRRIANLLALLVSKGESQGDSILALAAAGLTAAEVAKLLDTTPNTVAVAVYKAKKGAKKRSGTRRG